MKNFLSIFFTVLFFIVFFYFIFNVKVWFIVSIVLLLISLVIEIRSFGGIIFAIIFCTLFFYFKLYTEWWFWIAFVVLCLINLSEFVQHFLYRFISVIFGVLYFPLNFALMNTANWTKTLKNTDPVIYWLARIVTFPLLLFVTVFSIPFEWILDRAH